MFSRKIVGVFLASVLTACGGSEGNDDASASEDTQPNQEANSEIVTLKAELHQSLVDHCGTCHGDSGSFSQFAVSDRELAFTRLEERELINLSNPPNSQIVNYMKSEHNCGGSCEAWAAAFIDSVQDIADKSGDNVVSSPNPGVDSSEPEPAELNKNELVFSNTLYPILRENCSACHGEVDGTSGVEVARFAHDDVRIAYSVISNRSRGLVDFNRFESSLIVTRLSVDQHMCWVASGCRTNADTVVDAIKSWLLPETKNPPVPDLGAKNKDISIRSFEESVWSITREHCSFCHDGTLTDIPGHADANVELAHDAAVNHHLANVENPFDSILVQRLYRDQHYCWPDARACEQNAVMMSTAIGQWKRFVEKYNEESNQIN